MIFILPTDTCYGLAGSMNEDDYQGIYSLKWRDFSKQLAVLVRDIESLREMADISDQQLRILREYPHAWSVLLPKKESYVLPHWMDWKKYSTISFRVAEFCISSEFREKLAYPLFLTSANISGNPESRTLAEAMRYFPDIVWYDGWICDSAPSDIFSFGVDDTLVYLRKIRP